MKFSVIKQQRKDGKDEDDEEVEVEAEAERDDQQQRSSEPFLQTTNEELCRQLGLNINHREVEKVFSVPIDFFLLPYSRGDFEDYNDDDDDDNDGDEEEEVDDIDDRKSGVDEQGRDLTGQTSELREGGEVNSVSTALRHPTHFTQVWEGQARDGSIEPRRINIHFFPFEDYVIWGLTSMITLRVLEIGLGDVIAKRFAKTLSYKWHSIESDLLFYANQRVTPNKKKTKPSRTFLHSKL